MSSKNLDSKRYRTFGLWLSIFWLLIVACYLIFNCENPLNLPPNEFGDFLAGVFGPLGILWLILGFWQQGDELRNSVEALNLQSEELRNSVEQQKALVEITRSKAEAEILALKEEREARKLATSPKLILTGGGGSSKRVSLYLNNIGADCSDVRLMVVDGDYRETLRSFATLPRGANELVHMRCDTRKFLDFTFEVQYKSIQNESGMKRFSASRETINHVGFNILDAD
jgi:hypothetical protein